MALAPDVQARREANAWHPPANLLAAAQANPRPYVGIPAGLDHQLPIGPGLKALEQAVKSRFPVTTVYDRGRSLDAGAHVSMHHAGRAADLMVATVNHAPNHAVGDPIANWLLANAADLGVQYIIWAGTQWNSGTGRASLYTGTEDHFDHVHVELTPAAASGALRIPGELGTAPIVIAVGAGALAAVATAWWWLRR